VAPSLIPARDETPLSPAYLLPFRWTLRLPQACLRDTVLRLGGKFGGVSFVKPWHDYFPHFGAADLRANLHQQLDALQGQRRTLMVGEVFNLPLVSECVDFARYIIRRHMNVEAPGRSTSPGASDRPSRSVARRLLRTIGRRRRLSV
jgi:hypothetical protein